MTQKIVLRKLGKSLLPYDIKKEMEVIRLYAQIKGIKLYEGGIKNPESELFHSFDYFCTSPDMHVRNIFNLNLVPRDDLALVKVVEEGFLPNAVVVEIPDRVGWYVDWSDDEYCNEELIYEKHRIWNEEGKEIGRK